MSEGSVVAVTVSRPLTGRASPATEPLGLHTAHHFMTDWAPWQKLLSKGDARE